MGRGAKRDGRGSPRRASFVRDSVLSGAVLALCWSWVGTVTPNVSAVVAGGQVPTAAVSLAMFVLNIASLVVCALVRQTPRRTLPLWLLAAALSVGTALLRPLVPPGMFVALLCGTVVVGSLCTMSCLLAALEVAVRAPGSPVPVLASAFAVSGFVNALVTAVPGDARATCWLLLTCLPALTMTCAGIGRSDPNVRDLSPCTPGALRPLIKPAAGSFLYGVVFMGVWCMSLGSADLAVRDQATVFQSVVICLLFVAVIAVDRVSAARGRRLLESVVQRVVFSAYVVGTMVFSLVMRESVALSSLLVMSATALFEMTLFYWAVNWGRTVQRGAGACLAVLLGSLMAGQFVALFLFELYMRPVLGSIDPVVLGYLCLALVMPSALAVFIPMDINERVPETGEPAVGPVDGARAQQSDPQAPVNAVAADFGEFCRRCGFSPREAQVAELLAAGRSLPYIQEALRISEGTAKTHLRHIYDKAGVHRRQDFLSLVEKGAPCSTSSTSKNNQS